MKTQGEITLSQEAITLTRLAFRHGLLENFHAGCTCEACAGPERFSRVTNEEMRELMTHVIIVTFELLTLQESSPPAYASRVRFAGRYTAKWDEPATSPCT